MPFAKKLIKIFFICACVTGYALAAYIPIEVSNGSTTLSNIDMIQFNGDIIDLGGGSVMVEINGGSGSANAAGDNGSIQFYLNGDLAADATNLHYDNVNNYLGIGTNSPASTLGINGALSFTQEYNNGNSGASITVDFVNSSKQRVTLNSNSVTLTLDAPGIGNYLLKVIQDGSGSRLVSSWVNGGGGAIRWPSGVAPTLSTSGNAIDIISCYFDGTDYFCLGNLNFI